MICLLLIWYNLGLLFYQVESPKESNSSEQHDNASTSGGSSRFGRFGSQIFQKTVGLVLRSRADRQVSQSSAYFLVINLYLGSVYNP